MRAMSTPAITPPARVTIDAVHSASAGTVARLVMSGP
ncbi:Uncharacterised protein [Mycobacteroides abscessus subsp. abscessus]|nr:Uncharacterised protein [Mycobacteroides abscessus subsp. abscessus]SKV19257.1 Uncharacterised protein [Mycobacteroides abscessus subsp. abscessus]